MIYLLEVCGPKTVLQLKVSGFSQGVHIVNLGGSYEPYSSINHPSILDPRARRDPRLLGMFSVSCESPHLDSRLLDLSVVVLPRVQWSLVWEAASRQHRRAHKRHCVSQLKIKYVDIRFEKYKIHSRKRKREG